MAASTPHTTPGITLVAVRERSKNSALIGTMKANADAVVIVTRIVVRVGVNGRAKIEIIHKKAMRAVIEDAVPSDEEIASATMTPIPVMKPAGTANDMTRCNKPGTFLTERCFPCLWQQNLILLSGLLH